MIGSSGGFDVSSPSSSVLPFPFRMARPIRPSLQAHGSTLTLSVLSPCDSDSQRNGTRLRLSWRRFPSRGLSRTTSQLPRAMLSTRISKRYIWFAPHSVYLLSPCFCVSCSPAPQFCRGPNPSSCHLCWPYVTLYVRDLIIYSLHNPKPAKTREATSRFLSASTTFVFERCSPM
jgi:hypothetical protein